MTNRVNALSLAMEVVDDATRGLPFWRRGSAVDRAGAALEVARFLVGEEELDEGYDEEEPEQGETSIDGPLDLAEATPVGPARRVECIASPGDYAYVRPGKVSGKPFVHIEVHADGETESVFLAISEARRFAAGILDAADEAEGGSPLLHFVKTDA
ncbi:hypothetical protein [Micromonospora sp. NPDC047730]|uniref:hypothetical protein n=1 Tax=Micromonospora sp. NPDC047730 TaxID=3364253 RepID=UPI003715B976